MKKIHNFVDGNLSSISKKELPVIDYKEYNSKFRPVI